VGGVSAGRRALSSSFFDGFALERVDGVPIVEAFERADAAFAASWWHWFFFAQTAKPAEDIISRDPLARYRVDPSVMGAPNHADWERAVTNPAVVRAMVGDYRAGWEIDRFDEAADRSACRFVSCPTLFASSARDDMEELCGDPVSISSAPVSSVRKPFAPP
jgi:haloacetate dehalogenase